MNRVATILTIAALIADAQSGLSSAGFKADREDLWIPMPRWRDNEEDASEDPFDPQYLAAMQIMHWYFGPSKKLWVHLAAEMQAGKTGVVNALIRLLNNGVNYAKIGIDIERFYICSGMNDNEWANQTRKRVPIEVRKNVQHNANLLRIVSSLRKKVEREGCLKNIIVIIDESHIASSYNNQPARCIFDTMKQLCPVDQWAENNVRLMTISATDPASIIAAGAMREHAQVVRLLTSDNYQSIEKLKNAGRLHETYDLTQTSVSNLAEFIRTKYAETPNLYHILRPRPSMANKVIAALKERFPDSRVVEWDAKNNAKRRAEADNNSDESSTWENARDINDILRDEPEVPTFIVLKNMFYASKTLNDTHVGVLHDRKSAKDDTNLQSLVGRACGYNKSIRTHIFTTMSTIENYLEVWSKLGPRDGVIVPKDARSVDRRMAGVGASPAPGDNGGARLHLHSNRAVPFRPADVGADGFIPAAPPRVNAHDNFEAKPLEEFHTFEELKMRWDEILTAEQPLEFRRNQARTPRRDERGFYKCSVGGESEKQTAEAIRRFAIGSRSWGIGITNAGINERIHRVYVGYDGDRVIFFLRWGYKTV